MAGGRSKSWRWIVVAPLVPCAGILGAALPCLPPWLQYGVRIGTCPDGDPVGSLWVATDGLRRGAPGRVIVELRAHTATEEGGVQLSHSSRGSLRVELRAPDGTLHPLAPDPDTDWQPWGAAREATVTVPAALPDGVYTLIAHNDGPFGPLKAEVELPLFAPATIHTLTDRPLYEPGHELHARAVALRTADLVPLADRPGTFVLTDPNGVELLREAAPLDALGVAAVSIPLDADATHGAYQLCWSSGQDQGCAALQVKPFTLPRFTAEATPDRPWFRPGERLGATLRLRAASGAPVAGASVQVKWRVEGPWPPPTAWMNGELPTTLASDAQGGVALRLPEVPADLVGAAQLIGDITATDETGATIGAQLVLRLREEGVEVDALTELGGGVADGVRNRVWLRARLPDGQVLADTMLRVRRTWEPSAPPVEVQTDADGFAEVQLDPGPAVNMRVPSPPVRAAPAPAPAAVLAITQEGGSAARLDDQRAIGSATAAFGRCAHLSTQNLELRMRLKVDRGGRPSAATLVDPPRTETLNACLRSAALGLQLPAGNPRVLAIALHIADPQLPVLQPVATGVDQAPWAAVREDIVEPALLEARSCFSRSSAAGRIDADLIWGTTPGSATVTWDRAPRNEGSAWTDAEQRCVLDRILGKRLREPARVQAFGVVQINGSGAAALSTDRPGEVMLRPGYALSVEAVRSGSSLGTATLRLNPAPIPDRRLRVDKPTPAAGETVAVELLRGPNNPVELPDRLQLRHQAGRTVESTREADGRTFRFALPEDAQGWWAVQWQDATARVWVQDRSSLDLRITPAQAVAAPGDDLSLLVSTLRDNAPIAAHVSLVGVDESLGQLVPLPGPDAMATLRPGPTTTQPLAGLELAALTNGAIRGTHAITALVATAADAPPLAALDRPVSVSSADFDPNPAVHQLFFELLRRLYAEVRAWEASAPADARLAPATVAQLWSAALDQCAAEAPPCTDPFGRRLRLGLLPPELLALTEPRLLVRGERLPDDMEHWPTWVAEEDPR